MTTANLPVYGNITMYVHYCAVCLKIDYTLRCLEYMCSVSSPLRRHGLSLLWRPCRHLNRDDTDTCTVTNTSQLEDSQILIPDTNVVMFCYITSHVLKLKHAGVKWSYVSKDASLITTINRHRLACSSLYDRDTIFISILHRVTNFYLCWQFVSSAFFIGCHTHGINCSNITLPFPFSIDDIHILTFYN